MVVRESTSGDTPHYVDLAGAVRYGQARDGDLRRTLGSKHPQLGPEPPRGRVG